VSRRTSVVEIFKMDLITVGELTRTVLKGEAPTSDLAVQVENKCFCFISIRFFLRCWEVSR